MKSLFTVDNTAGYSSEELELLNGEWEVIVYSEKLEEFTEEYDVRSQQFSDEVANR